MSERTLVRLATPEDADTVGALIHALDAHYRGAALAPAAGKAAAMARHAMATGEGTHFALASLDGVPMGLAAFAVLRPGRDLQGVLYAKEIFVREEARGQGLGAALVAYLQAEAARRGLGRIELTTDPDNRAAQRFYERLGGERLEKIAYRFWTAPETLEP